MQEYSAPVSDRIHLLIVQPTPFCNIQCDYCYLPDRDSTARMERATFRELVAKVFEKGLVGDQLSIVWHAGEPMVLPPRYYADLLKVLDELSIPRPRIRHSVQTNGIPITTEWCDFIRENDFHIGVSIDGPAFIHDSRRKDRQGRGTHARVMKGVACLREHGIDFHVIAVVTADSLDHPDEIFNFFLDLGVARVGFNVEELEGEHLTSSVAGAVPESRMRRFWSRLHDLEQENAGAIRIREFDRAREVIAAGPPGLNAEQSMRLSSQIAPLGILSADWRGNLSSFSPELLGLKSGDYGDFVFGNIHETGLDGLLASAKFKRVADDIHAGAKRCEETCSYFELCGGGAPSNKYFENGSFDSTETMHCRTTIQMPVDIVLADLERRLGLRTGAD